MDTIDINGNPPELRGAKVDELLLQTFWYDGHLEDEANVVYLQTDKSWHRLYFDCGIIFWRPDMEGPKAFHYKNDDGSLSDFKITDFGRDHGLIGKRIEDYSMEPIHGGSRVRFKMQDGYEFGFENVDDVSRIIALGSSED